MAELSLREAAVRGRAFYVAIGFNKKDCLRKVGSIPAGCTQTLSWHNIAIGFWIAVILDQIRI